MSQFIAIFPQLDSTPPQTAIPPPVGRDELTLGQMKVAGCRAVILGEGGGSTHTA